MKHLRLFLFTLVAWAAIAIGANAEACYADYKAKQDDPLRLHYGIVELRSGCTSQSARAEIEQRLAGSGWTLLNVLSVFGPDGLSERKDSAGSFYLRF